MLLSSGAVLFAYIYLIMSSYETIELSRPIRHERSVLLSVARVEMTLTHALLDVQRALSTCGVI